MRQCRWLVGSTSSMASFACGRVGGWALDEGRPEAARAARARSRMPHVFVRPSGDRSSFPRADGVAIAFHASVAHRRVRGMLPGSCGGLRRAKVQAGPAWTPPQIRPRPPVAARPCGSPPAHARASPGERSRRGVLPATAGTAARTCSDAAHGPIPGESVMCSCKCLFLRGKKAPVKCLFMLESAACVEPVPASPRRSCGLAPDRT